MNSVNKAYQSDLLIKGKTTNILIVGNNPDNNLSLENILEKDERNIIKANSGDEALKFTLAKPIALVLLDMQMPDMDGFEVARVLKNNPETKDISIIFVTDAAEQEKFPFQDFEEGTFDFLLKPLNATIARAKVAVFEKLYIQEEALRGKTVSLNAINKQLEEFVYIVSHDLKAPLRGIASLASFIEDDLGADSKPAITETLNMLKSRCNRMQSLIDAILHYSRMTNNIGAPEAVDINELMKSIMESMVFPPNIKITFQENMPTVTGEKIKLQEIFQNLISNGVKYNHKEKGTVLVSCKDSDDEYEFSVTDNGSGIKEEHREKIFGIFQTLQPKDKVESTGIGLTIAKKLVEQDGGKLTVESVFGEGSTFRFTWKK